MKLVGKKSLPHTLSPEIFCEKGENMETLLAYQNNKAQISMGTIYLF